MTSLEHVFSDQTQQHQHELERGDGDGDGDGLMDRPSSSWAGSDKSEGGVDEGKEGQIVEVRGESEEEGEQVGGGVAVSGVDDEDEDGHVDVDVDVGEGGEGSEQEQEPEAQEPDIGYEGEREQVSIIVIGDEATEDEDEDEDENEYGLGVASSSGVSLGMDVSSDSAVSRSPPPRGRSSGVSPPGSAFRSRSASGSRSGSPSQSHSHSQSRSRSRSSIKEALEMGESSTATSWTQGDRPSGDSERRPSVDQQVKGTLTPTEEVRGGEVGREGREVVFGLARLRADVSGDLKSRKEELLVVQEEDIGEGWHPLRYNGKERSQEDDDEKGEGEGEGEEDVGSVGPLESTQGGKSSLEMNEKERWRAFGSAGRNSKHLRLEFKSPSPHPWDETDRQTDNNETYMSDYYSTLNSKKFGTLQKGRRRTLIPHSAYYFGPPAPDAAYGSPPVGQIGVHHPREIVRIERDYGGGELAQFSPIYPLELEGRITPTQFLQTINDINEILISAHSIRRAFFDNLLAVITLQLSTLVMASHYTREMRRLKRKLDELNVQLYNPAGLNVLWPQKVGFLFLEIEYY